MKTRVAVVLAVVVAVAVLAVVLLRKDDTEPELTGAAKEVEKYIDKRIQLTWRGDGGRETIEGRVTIISPKFVEIEKRGGKIVRIRRAAIRSIAPAGPAGDALFGPQNISSNEVAAVAGLRVIATGQNTWHRNDYDSNGILDFTPTYRLLHYQLDPAGRMVKMIDKALADASGPGGIPKNGYRYGDMVSHWQTGAYNYRYEYGHCAWPATYGVTGRHTFITSVEGTIYKRDLGQASTLIPVYPNTNAGWTIVR